MVSTLFYALAVIWFLMTGISMFVGEPYDYSTIMGMLSLIAARLHEGDR